MLKTTIWPLYWNIWLVKFWKWQGMQLVMTRVTGRSKDEELRTLLSVVIMAQAGVLPNIQAALFPKKTGNKLKWILSYGKTYKNVYEGRKIFFKFFSEKVFSKIFTTK